MKTKIFNIKTIDKKSCDAIKEAAEILKKGGLVAFPTETVYGLGADALNSKAVEKIYSAKGRPSDNPLIVHISEIDDLGRLISERSIDVDILAKAFWPGPLTMVLPKKNFIPYITTGGLDTVAVRMPDNPIALELIKQAGCPIAAPSANISGRPSPTSGDHVVQDLFGRVDAIIRGDDCKIGIESTVLDMTTSDPVILRPGFVTPEELGKTLQKKIIADESLGSLPRSPGTKYTHYAPKAEMYILEGSKNNLKREMRLMKENAEYQGLKVGLLQFDGESYEDIAKNFFAGLRKMDDENVDLILAAALDSSNSLGFALMNRMLKAAGYKIKQV